MAVQFDYRSGILEAADPDTGAEWCWFKGDAEATKSVGGAVVGTISIPSGATVTQAKAVIRQDVRPRKNSACGNKDRRALSQCLKQK